MVAINTTNNGVAMAALRRVNAELTTTQNRIATGYRVNSAKDDPSVWATAATLRSDISASEATKTGLTTAKAQADAGIASLDEISQLLQRVNDIVISAKAAGAASDAQVAEIVGIQTSITALVDASGVSGKNVLKTGNNLAASVTITNGAAAGSVAYTSSDFVASTNVALVLAASDSATVLALDGKVALAQGEVAATASKLGGLSRGADSLLGFVDKLADIRNSALGGLVDADLERETAKLQALQVRQQLAYQAISMSNNSAQNVLMLFR